MTLSTFRPEKNLSEYRPVQIFQFHKSCFQQILPLRGFSDGLLRRYLSEYRPVQIFQFHKSRFRQDFLIVSSS